jgi:uncharacterized membrane protein
MTGQLRWARRRTGPAKKQIFSRLRVQPWFGRPDHASLVMTEGGSSYQSPEPDVDDAMNASLPKHPPIAHVVVGSYVAAGVFDLLSVLPVGFMPSRDVYRAATFLLILATSALVFAAASGFRDRAKWTASGSQTRRLANLHAGTTAALGLVAVFDIMLRSYVYPSATQAPLAVLLATALLCVLTGVGGRLGGALVFRLGVGRAVDSRTALSNRPT